MRTRTPDLLSPVNNPMAQVILCCDWGTSFFRLQLLDQTDYLCLGELRSPAGIAATFADWKATGEPNGVRRDAFFRRQLSGCINQLARQLSRSLAGIPVVISGMASSSIGMDDVPYATLPFALDGSQASIRHFEAQTDFPHEIHLIAGVSSGQDVMRGEETQLIGLLALLGKTARPAQKSIFVFPGTHAKHISVEDGQVVYFDTYMTGELFDLMAHQSILKDSVDTRQLTLLSDSDKAAFSQGVGQATSAPVLKTLFSVRINELFNKLTKRQNALYLSGLLIGSELGYLADKRAWQIVLCCSSDLATFYTLAIEALHLSEMTRTVSSDLVDRAASVGQIQLYQHLQTQQPTV